MDNIVKILGIAIVSVMLIVPLRTTSRDMSDMVKIVAGVVVAGAVILLASPLVSFVLNISEESHVGTYITVMLKSLAVAFLTHICSSVCRDCGENTIASYAELAGKVEMLIIALPLLEEIIDVVQNLVEMI